MENEHNQFYGVIADRFSETDYQLGSDLEIPRASRSFRDGAIEYNQKEVSPVSCTIHGAVGAVSDLTGRVFSVEERSELWKQALELGADPAVGWYIDSAVNLVRKFVGENKLTSLRVEVGSENFFKALRLGYSVVAGYRGNSKYNADRNEDGILDGLDFGVTTYGHCIRIAYSVGDEYEIIVDNYVGGSRKFNVYKVSSENFRQLVKNRVFFRSGYIFTIKAKVDEANEGNTFTLPIWASASWEKALKKGVVAPTDNPLQEVGNAFLEETLVDSGVFTKKEGGISLVRWIVALDRLGALE